MKSNWHLKILLLVAATLTSFVLFEFALRMFTVEPENLAKLKSSSLFLYENKPNAVFEYGAGEFKNQIKMNSDGFRDDDFTKEKGANTFRIAVLGDSQEEALQVDLAETWQKIMAKKLSEEMEKRVETNNFGVSGYGTDQEWLALREKVWQYRPDMVILAFSPNDVGDTYKNKLIEVGDGKISVIGAKQRAGGNFLGRHVRETYTYHLIVKAASANPIFKRLIDEVRAKILGFAKEERFYLSDAQLAQGPFEVIASQKNPPKEVLKAWQIVEALIEDMKLQTREHGAKFLITINIPRAQVDPSSWEEVRNQYKLDAGASPYEINEVLGKFASDQGIALYDPRLDAIAWRQEMGDLHYLVDAHYNKNGHQFMGEKVADFILGSGLLN